MARGIGIKINSHLPPLFVNESHRLVELLHDHIQVGIVEHLPLFSKLKIAWLYPLVRRSWLTESWVSHLRNSDRRSK